MTRYKGKISIDLKDMADDPFKLIEITFDVEIISENTQK